MDTYWQHIKNLADNLEIAWRSEDYRKALLICINISFTAYEAMRELLKKL